MYNVAKTGVTGKVRGKKNKINLKKRKGMEVEDENTIRWMVVAVWRPGGTAEREKRG